MLLGSFRTRRLIVVVLFVFLLTMWSGRGSCLAQPNSAPVAVPHQSLAQQDRAAEYRARFEKESDPVRKAKLMVRLGAAEFDQIQKQIGADDADAALKALREYQAQATSCEKALDARGVDPEKHPAGYKELQISIREALRRLDNMMVSLTGDEQAPFREIRKGLDDLNRDLIKELFPKKPGAGAGSGKSDD